MGKHVKLGKQRKDRFYKLAKETGFRSRAAFKLIQLNRKFEFLQKSCVLVDLCAAPGGWLQVAQQSMPVSSLIIGVDLVSIKPIPNVITLQEDITTDKCKQALKRQLKTWKADAVLHDGAPNVGKSWLHDAFAQAQLTLSALKLATEILKPGGWFITKVFRSKDYNSLLWVLRKLFKKVHATKPQASRNESAEIYIVCQSYIAPDRIDPRFLDTSSLFKDVEPKTEQKINLLKPSKKKPKAEGYEEGDKSVFNELKASEFIFSDNHMELLAKCGKIVFDDDDIKEHRTTTAEIREYCEDIKVLGKSEIKQLLNWRKKLRDTLKQLEKRESQNVVADPEDHVVEEVEIENAVSEAKDLELSKYQQLKRKKKKMLKEKRKLRDKIDLKMVFKNDEPIIEEDRALFSIKMVKSKDDLSKLEDDKELEVGDEDKNEDEIDEPIKLFRSSYVKYSRHSDHEIWPDDEPVKSAGGSNDTSDAENEEEEMAFETVHNNESDSEGDASGFSDGSIGGDSENKNPLLVDLAEKDEKVNDVVSKWFDKEDFEGLDEGDDIDLELLTENIDKAKPAKEVAPATERKTLTDVAATMRPKGILKRRAEPSCDEKDEGNAENVDPSPEEPKEKKKKKKKVILDPEGLALGSLMIRSKKTKRDILDAAYNRYASNDENLPDWFVRDEEKHYRKQLPVTAEMVNEYKAQLREINARPIKKVIEAKSRKKRKAMKKLERARKRAEAITDDVNMGEKEKVEQLKSIYKKALAKKNDQVTYVVAKKGIAKRARRPPGVKGRYKIVDRRMKKDERKRKLELKSQNKKGFKRNKLSKRKK